MQALSEASARAIARPLPEEEPVTIATRSLRLKCCVSTVYKKGGLLEEV